MGLGNWIDRANSLIPGALVDVNFGGLGGGGGGGQQSMGNAAAAWDPTYAWGLHSGKADPTKFAPGARTLYDILGNPGQTDSTLFNRGLTANSRSTASRANQAQGQFTRAGLGNSGLATAFGSAIQGAGADKEADMRATEARRKEDLKRQDLQLLYQFILEPQMQKYAADRGVSLSQSQSKDQKNAGYAASAAALIGGLAAAFCYVADELYGFGSEEAILSRYAMLAHVDEDTFDAYVEGGRGLAERIKDDPALRTEVKTIFDGYVGIAKADFPTRF